MNQSPVAKPVLIIKPTYGWIPLNLRDLWDYHELIGFLAWRDISARYKQTLVGIAWAVLQPLLAMAVFTIFFGRLANIPSDNEHYPIFCYAAMLPWQFFSTAALNSSNSLIRNVHLLTKVHFPRLTIPVSSIIPPLVDLAAASVVLLALMLHFHEPITWRLLFLPVFLLLALVTALGTGVWMSALSVQYRDIHHVLPFIMQIWLFASPVVYSSNLVPSEYRSWYGLNPMAGVIAGFRWAVLGTPGGERLPMVCLSVLMAVVLLITGAFYFRRMERTFADVV